MSNKKPAPIKGRKSLKYRSTECLNCGHPLDMSDRYCSYCSQLNTTKSLSLKDFIGEFIGSIITYDSRFRYTLKDLLFKPGTITRKYVEGKRLRYANPFRFFLSVSIIYFLVQSLIGFFTGNNNLITTSTDGEERSVGIGPSGENIKLMTSLPDSLAENVPQERTAVNLDKLLKDGYLGEETAIRRLDSIIDANNPEISRSNVDSTLKALKNIPEGASKKEGNNSYELVSESELDTMNWVERTVKRAWLYRSFYRDTKIEDPKVALESLNHKNNRYNRWVYSKNEALERIEKNPGAFLDYLLAKTPFFLFFFTPLFAICFWILYYFKPYTYMEHMIFIFHVFSFVFLTALICLIPDTLIGSNIFVSIMFSLIGPFYFYKALRNFYQENRLITVIKFVLLNTFFMIGVTIGAIIFFAFTAVLY